MDLNWQTRLLANVLDQPLGGLREQTARGVNNNDGVRRSLVPNVLQQPVNEVNVSPAEVHQEVDDVEAVLSGSGDTLGALIGYVVGGPVGKLVPEPREACWDLNDYTVHPTVGGDIDIVWRSATESKDIGAEIQRRYGGERVGVIARHGRHSDLDSVHSSLVKQTRNVDLVSLAEDNSGRLLTVAQRDVVESKTLR